MQIFFVLGAQKSGTTWLQRLLSGLPSVLCRGEGHFVDGLVLPIAKTIRSYNQLMVTVEQRVYQGSGEGYSPLQQNEFDAFCRQIIHDRLLARAPQGLLAIGDKTPANALHLATLHRLFPDAKYIHLVRDGRDVAVSNYCHIQRVLEANPQGQPIQPFAAMAAPLIQKWSDYLSAAQAFQQKNPLLPWLQVSYEQLLSDPEQLLMTISEFLLGEAADSEHVKHAVKVASFESLTRGRQRGTEDQRSFLRKGIQGDWQAYYTPEIYCSIPPEAVQLLRKLGYTSAAQA
jgi:LPS sulfotransferase NodH